MSSDDKLLLIRNYDLWCNLNDDDFEELNVVHHFMETKKDDYIYFDSHLSNRLFFLKDGHIKIGYIGEDGQEVIKEIIQEGEVFGQFTLEQDNLNGEFARAYKGDVSLCAFRIEDFEKILQKKPLLAIKYSKLVGQKLRHAEFRLVHLLNRDVRSRLLAFFYQLALQHGYDGISKQFSTDNFLTHEDVARLIGSARQTVTTELISLDDQGLVTFSRKTIHLPDVKKIQKLVIVT